MIFNDFLHVSLTGYNNIFDLFWAGRLRQKTRSTKEEEEVCYTWFISKSVKMLAVHECVRYCYVNRWNFYYRLNFNLEATGFKSLGDNIFFTVPNFHVCESSQVLGDLYSRLQYHKCVLYHVFPTTWMVGHFYPLRVV